MEAAILRREVGQGSIVGFAVVHEDLALAADAEMLLAALSRVGHGDEGHMRGGESL